MNFPFKVHVFIITKILILYNLMKNIAIYISNRASFEKKFAFRFPVFILTKAIPKAFYIIFTDATGGSFFF